MPHRGGDCRVCQEDPNAHRVFVGQIDFSSDTVIDSIFGLPPAANNSRPIFAGSGRKHELIDTLPSLAKTSRDVRSTRIPQIYSAVCRVYRNLPAKTTQRLFLSGVRHGFTSALDAKCLRAGKDGLQVDMRTGRLKHP